jgi:NAD(P)-dependent dehydrogenase (short-subunit alcohol dehydrogenase family)
MTKRFEGKVVVVTRASSGIGKYTAQAFGREGASVVVTTGTNVKGGEATARSITDAGGEAVFIANKIAYIIGDRSDRLCLNFL